MKKTLIPLILLALIVPQIALASWWNPFSWSIFHRTETKTEVLEKKIQELEAKLSTASPTTSVITTAEATSSKKKIITPISQPVSKSVQSTVTKTDNQICVDYYGSNSLWSGQRDGNGTGICGCKTGFSFNTQITSCVSNFQYCSEKWPNSSWDGTFDTQGKFSCTCVAGYELNGDGSSCQKAQTATEKLIEQQNQTEKNRQQAEADRKNSPECVSARNAWDNVQNKLAKLRSQMDDYKSITPNYYSSAKYSEFSSKEADLSLESVPLRDKYYLACQNFVPTPPKMTTCNFIGNTMYCQ
jgi:hypothetical protein